MTLSDRPCIVCPGNEEERVALLQAQLRNLRDQNDVLSARVDLGGAGITRVDGGFNLRAFLTADGRTLYTMALSQTSGNAAEAARLLSVDARAFRACPSGGCP